jgi:DNA polymerase-3 subunit alpha
MARCGIDDAIAAARGDDMPALAVTDLSNVFGVVKFYRAARAQGLKPIVGCDVWLTHDAERDQPFRALLLAQSRAGYLKLADWLTRAYRTNQHRGRAELKRDWLDEGTDGLIALSGARDGEVGSALLQGNATGLQPRRRARGRICFRDATTWKSSAPAAPRTMRSSPPP